MLRLFVLSLLVNMGLSACPGAFVEKDPPMCPHLYEHHYDCGGGVAPLASGCCPDTKKCPPGCRGGGTIWGDGSKCECKGCPLAPKPALEKLPIAEKWVKAHNYYRCLHGVEPLRWDEEVATNARKHAEKCEFAHSDSYHNTPPSGENLGWNYRDPFQTVQAWYSEINGFKNGAGHGECKCDMCGHYTAMIWKSTTKLGCAQCLTAKEPIDVCQYADSPPNMGGEYQKNVPDTQPVNTPENCCEKIFGRAEEPENERVREEAVEKEKVREQEPETRERAKEGGVKNLIKSWEGKALRPSEKF